MVQRIPPKRPVVRAKYFFILSFLLAFTLISSPTRISQASSPITVTTFQDSKQASDGLCSLREAIIAANTDSPSGVFSGECAAGIGADTIILPAGIYTLTRTDSGNENASQTGDLDINGDLTIVGAGADVTIIEGSGLNDRLVHVLAGQVSLIELTLRHGSVSGHGGAIYNTGRLTVTDVTLQDNYASETGGGIFSLGVLQADAVSIVGNNANGLAGGGVVVGDGTAVFTNSTISGNSTNGAGGGLANKGETTLNFVTIAHNSAQTATGIHSISGDMTLNHTLVNDSCRGVIVSQGYNLIQDATKCTITGDPVGNLLGVDALLAPLALNGGSTLNHALLPESPAIEAGSNSGCPATDQRGVSRPRGLFCDIGAYELANPPQTGAALVVNTADDNSDGVCDFAHCSLREAIIRANASAISNQIHFNIPGDLPPVIYPLSPLPVITDPVVFDGFTQAGGVVVLDGSLAGTAVGLEISAGSSTVRGLRIVNFGSHGLLLTQNGNNVISGNEVAFNGGDGIRILAGTGNQLSGNNIHDNGGLAIDLGGDGRTVNDPDDPDSGANSLQNYPQLFTAVPLTDSLRVDGRLDSTPLTAFTLEFFATPTCDLSGGSQTFLGTTQATTDALGNVYFQVAGLTTAPLNSFVTATATDPDGNTSELSDCVVVSPGNTSWVTALPLDVLPDMGPTAVGQYLDQPGQSRWYKFPVQPGSQVIVTLTDLPDNYDLTIYKDIAQAYNDLLSPQDLPRFDAEFAPEAFSPEAFSPEAFSPEAFSPEAFSPEAFSPEAFSPEAFSPEAFSPEAFSPEAFSPEAFSPDAFSPEAFSPEAFSPEAFSPEAFSPEAFSPEAFSGAQLRSLLGVSAFRGTANEGLIINTWNNTGYFYVRVRGTNGVFNTQHPFQVSVTMQSGSCGNVTAVTEPSTTIPTAGNYQTIILTDMARMAGTAAEKATLATRLSTYAARPEVAGVIVDVGADARAAAANAQADAYLACPYAKNLVAATIKEIVDGYRALNPLAYVVIVGNDSVIPFYRYPDNALLANESNYVPPVRDNTASQASLRLGFVLGQDEYGARTAVSFKNSAIPIPDLAVGRVVETAVQATVVLDAYLATTNGVVTLNTSPLVTGYDFLEDAALAVQAELEAGLNQTADTLIAANDLAPTDPAAWTADDLRANLLGSRHDITFLAGHFSASGALAADYSTRMRASELISAPVNLQNAIIFSAGCHAGYNIVDADGVPLVTEEPDWAQAFNSKGALLIAGTGYQYGDTDFIEYSERLYLEFSQELRRGSGPVSVGQAWVAAKQTYLAETPQMRGIHEKALIQATIFGLPQLSVNMPGVRLPSASEPSVITSVTPVSSNPGSTLGLATADLTLTPAFTGQTVEMTNVQDSTTVDAFYLTGPDGILTNPAEPTLPLDMANVTAAGTHLRGVGFRGGSYTDMGGILPFTGAPTTEIRGVHAPFQADIFYPVQFWRANYFGQLADPVGGATGLAVTPAQFMSDAPGALTGTMRRYDQLNFRLFYNNNIAAYAGGSTPALSAPPTIQRVTAVPQGGDVYFSVDVLGNPAAGMQAVWVLYTAVTGPYYGQWQPLDLSQNATISTRWEGSLPLNGTDPANMRYLVQAVNGVGLVSLAANLGDLYVPGAPPTATTATTVTLINPPTTGVYNSHIQVTAQLAAGTMPLAGQRLTFGLGPQTRQAITDATGQATVTLTLLGVPGQYPLRASFAGSGAFGASSAAALFTITKQDTALTLAQPASGLPGDDALLTATLTAADGRYLGEKSVVFVINGAGGAHSQATITDYAGRASLGQLPLPPGEYSVNVYFSGSIPLHTGEVLTLDDARYNPSTTGGTLTLEVEPPDELDCSTAVPTPHKIWPANKQMVLVSISGVIGSDGAPATLTVTAIRQDEPVGHPPHAPDGIILSGGTVRLRAERLGNGNGRVYHIFFTATDNLGVSCEGVARVAVAHDLGSGIDAIDGGPLYDSTQP
ncbi:MAG: CSLREA domain-containing protein [Anaerolineae bacterium]|nr:CSLREA domain-containing protein [Anaerolineae bacterium]